MKKHFLFLFSLLLLPWLVSAQIPNILVDADANNAECTMVINPKNPDYILGAVLSGFIYLSSDGGQTWDKIWINDFSNDDIGYDPAVAADTAGHFFYQAMDWQNVFHTLRSDDYGTTWNTETEIGFPNCFEDKNWMAVDRSPLSPYIGRLYTTWTLRYASGCATAGYFFIQYSTDAGATWSDRDTLDVDPTWVPPIGGGMAIGKAGEVNVTWSGGQPNQIHFKKSLNGGNSWPPIPVIVDDNVEPENDYAAGIDHSIGITSAMTSLACDISGGAYSGNLYCVWDDLRNGQNNADIFLARSEDFGLTWETQRINDDSTVRNQILPQVAVDPSSGWVYVSYVDARLNTDNFDDTLNYYLAWSDDGGEIFHNLKVSEQPNTLTWLHSDYMGLDAFDGRACMLWVGGTPATGQQAWTACMNQGVLTAINELTPPPSHGLFLYPAIPNPAIDFTTLDFELAEAGAVSLSLYAMNGALIATPVMEKNYSAGRHQLRIDHGDLHLPAGIYLATLTSEGQSVSRKIKVLR